MTRSELLLALRPLLAAECAAEAAAAGADAADLEQAVWVRLLGCREPAAWLPRNPAGWLRAAVRAEARTARRTAAREISYHRCRRAADRLAVPGPGVEEHLLARERLRALRTAVRRLPGRCPLLLSALLSHKDPTYPEIAQELGISQGSVGPVRSRCLERLRRMLMTGIAAPEPGGMRR